MSYVDVLFSISRCSVVCVHYVNKPVTLCYFNVAEQSALFDYDQLSYNDRFIYLH